MFSPRSKFLVVFLTYISLFLTYSFCRHKVRKAACASLGRLAVFSSQFADGAINLLMDLLNDDNSLVRLQTLDTMFHMVSYDQLKVEEAHMHMVGLSVFLTYYGAY